MQRAQIYGVTTVPDTMHGGGVYEGTRVRGIVPLQLVLRSESFYNLLKIVFGFKFYTEASVNISCDLDFSLEP